MKAPKRTSVKRAPQTPRRSLFRSGAQSVNESSRAGHRGADGARPAVRADARCGTSSRAQKRRHVRRIVLGTVGVVASLAVAFAVAVAVLFSTVSGKMELVDSDARSALTPQASGQPFYTLVSVDLDGEGQQGIGDGADAFALVRIDEGAGRVSVLSLPATLPVTLRDGKQHALRDAAPSDGDAALVRAVAAFADVDVSHLVKVDAAGLVTMVDALGGVDVTVPEEVDDPTAGDVYIPAGQQHLDGTAALTFARASNYETGSQRQSECQRTLLCAVAAQLLDESDAGLIVRLDQVGGAFQCDVDARTALSIAEPLRGFRADDASGALVPGYDSTALGTTLYTVSLSEWDTLRSQFTAGDSVGFTEEPTLVDPGSFTLTVRNGGGVTGAAAQIAQTLSNKGFDVKETGNTDTAVYSDTLVVYNDDAYEAAANTVVDALGAGRTVPGLGVYSFDTNVLVVVGRDWKPTA